MGRFLPVLAALCMLPVRVPAQDAPEPPISTSTSSAQGPGLSGAGVDAPVSSGAPVVQANRLLPLLPPAPAGWNADKPEGTTTQSTGFQITTVGNTYVKGTADDAPTATITIIDSANNQQFQESTKAMWSATGSTPEGYDKAITLQGLPGFEHFTNADQSGVLWVIAGGRFFVQIETTHQPVPELEAWLSRIDLKKLSALK